MIANGDPFDLGFCCCCKTVIREVIRRIRGKFCEPIRTQSKRVKALGDRFALAAEIGSERKSQRLMDWKSTVVCLDEESDGSLAA